MVLILSFALLFLFGCTDWQRDHAYDPNGVNYVGEGGAEPSSSSGIVQPSSSSLFAGGSGCSIDGYRTVTIGEQTWMAENLNCEVDGSKCNDNEPANCVIYGRLYNWATAMNLDPSCNSSPCSSQVNAKHRGICPEGSFNPYGIGKESSIFPIIL